MPLPLPADLINVSAAARLLGTHCSCIYRWIASGKLPAWRIGGRYKLSRAEVVAFPKRSGPGIPDKAGGKVVMTHEQAQALLRQAGWSV